MTRADLTRDEYSEGLNVFMQPVSEAPFKRAVRVEKPLIDIEQEQKYKAVFECANDIILVIDNSGVVIDVNERLTEIGGYRREEIIGKKCPRTHRHHDQKKHGPHCQRLVETRG